MVQLPDLSVGAAKDNPEDKIESIVKQINEQARLISNEDRTKVIRDDSGKRRILIGYQQDGFDSGNVGMKVSQPGVDVFEATDSQLIFNTDNNSFKIAQTGTVNIQGPGSAGATREVTVDHTLGYAPVAIAYLDFGTQSEPLPYRSVQPTGADAGKVNYEIYFWTDSTEIHFFWQDILQGTGGTYPIRYYILQETAAS